MSNRLFSATGAVWHCGPKRVKRTWGGTLVGLLALLALSALAGWLLTLLRHGAGISHCVTSSGMMLAMAPVPLAVDSPAMQGLATGLLMFFSAAGVVLVIWRARVDAVARMRWAVVDERTEGEDLASPAACEDPLALPATGMKHEELQRILTAMIVEACEARDMVRKAQEDCAVQDCGDRLQGASKRLLGVITCLGNLAHVVAEQRELEPTEPLTTAKKKCIYCPNCGVLAGIEEVAS